MSGLANKIENERGGGVHYHHSSEEIGNNHQQPRHEIHDEEQMEFFEKIHQERLENIINVTNSVRDDIVAIDEK